jgi:RHS repeat-associated protein
VSVTGSASKGTQRWGGSSPPTATGAYEWKGAQPKWGKAGGAILKGYSYNYDGVGNRTVEAIDTLVTGETSNNLNQLTAQQSGAGVLPIRGITNEPASSVNVNGTPAVVKTDNTFEGKANVVAGDNTVTVAATDVNGNTATNNYNVSVTGSGTKSLVYDPNGNLTTDGTKTYEWDPLNRLTAINNGTQRSEFTYNGLNQRVKIVEKDNGNPVMTRNLVWAGSDILEWRNANNVVQRRLYPQGVQIGTANYYYTRDHLGSIRELTTSTGTLVGRYDYDPYGRRTTVSGGSISPDFGFAGMYHHNRTSFNLTQYRAYSADFGRWISRDPLQELGGLNVYRYVAGNPMNWVDPLGLDADIYVVRTSRGSPTVVKVFENGQYLGAYVGNSVDGGLVNSDYSAGKGGPADGTYELKPRTDWQPGDRFDNGTPAITGPDQPTGYPNSSYKNPVFFHPGGFPNASTGCQTASDRSIIDSLTNLMMNNMNDGGTSVHFTTLPDGILPGIPVVPFPSIPLR